MPTRHGTVQFTDTTFNGGSIPNTTDALLLGDPRTTPAASCWPNGPGAPELEGALHGHGQGSCACSPGPAPRPADSPVVGPRGHRRTHRHLREQLTPGIDGEPRRPAEEPTHGVSASPPVMASG